MRRRRITLITTMDRERENIERIRIWGIVQGVGFRPFVAKLAKQYDMRGQVRNLGGLVELILWEDSEKITSFLNALQTEKPGPAEIVHMDRRGLSTEEVDGALGRQDRTDFTILESGQGDREVAMIPADMAICPACRSEMQDPENPRYRHPFISCMECGPRYTIVDRFPYDRDNTSMVDFPMCDFCHEEYTDLTDRRFHAQTISCHDCGPQMEMILPEGSEAEDEDPLREAARLLRRGKVIAFKSMGGYNLVADPFCRQATETLRAIKHREKKPFAILFHDPEQIKGYCRMDEVEERLLGSSARPIVLLERRNEEDLGKARPNGDLAEVLQSRFIGSFLPSMGAQYILLEEFGGPLIFTSANRSDMPMITEEEAMTSLMEAEGNIAGIFYNGRKIRIRMDDSVCRAMDGHPQMIRRSKGYAPVPLYMPGGRGELLATGGQLKNSFSISKGPFAYVSQYFGDMDSVENQAIYREQVERMSQLFRIHPEAVVCDLHPGYFTTTFAKEYAAKHDLPLRKIQHHHAHIGSVMAEHDLDEVIGVSFDGTGYGTDGAIWGGEILHCRGAAFDRLSHLAYVDLIGGDRSMKEGWKSAFGYLYHEKKRGDRPASEGTSDPAHTFFPDLSDVMGYAQAHDTLSHRDRKTTFRALEAGINVHPTSSMGRLFDGVAAMLGICDENGYEGQCAILLEDAAARYRRGQSRDEADELAHRFHQAIIEEIRRECLKATEKTGCRNVALSGGVFQNRILMEGSLTALRSEGLTPYYNISVSPNDGGIALGQNYLAALAVPGAEW